MTDTMGMMGETSLRMARLAGAGFCCAQIFVLLALEDLGRDNPDLVRAAQGLCLGAGDCAGPCGALTGAALVLGLHAGRGQAGEEPHDRLPLMLAELNDWFRETVGTRHGGVSCGAITGGDCTAPDRAVCGAIVAETFERTMDLLAENGIDPTLGRPA